MCFIFILLVTASTKITQTQLLTNNISCISPETTKPVLTVTYMIPEFEISEAIQLFMYGKP